MLEALGDRLIEIIDRMLRTFSRFFLLDRTWITEYHMCNCDSKVVIAARGLNWKLEAGA